MPYPREKGNNKVRPRYSSLQEAGYTDPIMEDNYGRVNDYDHIFKDLGIKIGEDRKIPTTGINPRIFIMKPDENGIDKITTLEGAGIEYGSKEFWNQCLMGNIFAYPAGEKDPVQIQATDDALHIQYSEPITAENFPSPAVKQPNLWQRFAHLITGGRAYKKEWEDYYVKAPEGKERVIQKLADLKTWRDDDTVNKEREIADEQIKTYEEDKQKKAEADALASAKREKNSKKKGLDNATSVFKPEAEFREDFHKIPDGPNKKFGLYTTEHFNDLVQYGKDKIDLSKIQVGNTGKPVSDEEFACVAMLAGWNPKISAPAYGTHGAAKDIHAKNSFIGAGISEEETDKILGAFTRSMYTTDLFDDNPRDNSGTYFKGPVNNAKKDAVEAFNAYKDGDRTKLAKIIANGLNDAASEICGRETPSVGANSEGVMVITDQVVKLLEKDPTLLDEAKKQGLDPEKYKTCKGVCELNRIHAEKKEAAYALAQDVYGENRNKLTKEQKAEYAKKIVKSDIAFQRLVADNMNEPEEVMNKQLELQEKMEFANKFKLNEWAEHPESRPAPPQGKIWHDTAGAAIEYYKTVKRNQPKSVQDLTDKKYEAELDKIAAQVVKQENLAEKSSEELYKGLSKGELINIADSSKKAIQALADPDQQKNAGIEIRQDQPAVNAPNKTGSIADRAKMFENKEPQNGPQAGGPV